MFLYIQIDSQLLIKCGGYKLKKKILLTFVCTLLFLTSISLVVNADIISTVIYDNNPPNPPTIEGPTSGNIDEYYMYYVTITDPDEDDLLLKVEVDFGDGTTEVCGSCTSQPWHSGDVVEIEHRWNRAGTYGVTGRVQDEFGVWGEWSEPLEVSMPKPKANFFSFFQRIRALLPNLYNIR
jgi:hypothetical protein